jgi:XisH protein
MSAKDRFHDAVKRALQKDGWTVTNDPLTFRYGGVDVYIDLAAEQVIAAERGSETIAVEIKSFLAPSAISEFHTALGQLLNYRTVLKRKDPARTLYLAVPAEAYEVFFQLEFTQAVIEDYQLKLIIYNIETEEIVQWKN